MSRIEELPETVGLRVWILRHPLLQTFVLVSILIRFQFDAIL